MLPHVVVGTGQLLLALLWALSKFVKYRVFILSVVVGPWLNVTRLLSNF